MMGWFAPDAAAAPISWATEVRGPTVHVLGGYPDLVGGEIGGHFGGWHAELGASNLIYIDQVFLRGGPEWRLASAVTPRGSRWLLLSPSVEGRAMVWPEGDVEPAAAVSVGLAGLVPLGRRWSLELRADAGATALFGFGDVVGYGRLSLGFARLAP